MLLKLSHFAVISLCFFSQSNGFSHTHHRISIDRPSTNLFATVDSITDLKAEIEKSFLGTDRGLKATSQQQDMIDELVTKLENSCPLQEPARSPLMGGKWIVDYTTAPPPSNGQLGPFKGIARQIIDLEKGTYLNYLSVPGDINKEWLSATLEATFEEWDGVLLEDEESNEIIESEEMESDESQGQDNDSEDDNDNIFGLITSFFNGKASADQNNERSKDYGADSWKVDFKTLTIKAFGFKLVEKKFDEGTSRVWKMSYLDDSGTRVVRAGRTGKKEDDVLFYMSRED
ncbi:hypothetical protein CTEN210_08638 [Chaetoceros tenuissimus]|uniref:Plastid lipid-associated protein/fibrillin conserved domain-containing protein n=1 Tax=Chaetoceros tenuissimus TaxID=426638 RepID=A0AAD3CU69_9STRA|nr:hypothetical protein CTEN210_08638 [Chaetoceros tenuissimus]